MCEDADADADVAVELSFVKYFDFCFAQTA
jgi:hypothetical protein